MIFYLRKNSKTDNFFTSFIPLGNELFFAHCVDSVLRIVLSDDLGMLRLIAFARLYFIVLEGIFCLVVSVKYSQIQRKLIFFELAGSLS